MQSTDAGGLPSDARLNQIDHSEENRSRCLLQVQLVSGGLFFAVAIWGVIDAIRNFQREVPLRRQSSAAPSATPGAVRCSGRHGCRRARGRF